MKSICHLTSVHPRFDVRIFLKQCRSLAAAGYEVTLVVADGKGDETKEGIRIYDAGIPKGRLDRMLRTTRRVHAMARELDADVYHLHDPELLPVGLKLKRLRKKVIFDAHEDISAQILAKPYLNDSVRRCVSWCYKGFESWACSRLDGIIAATPHIRDQLLPINANTVDVNNFPLAEEFASHRGPALSGKANICYVGSISGVRGIREMVQAVGMTRSRVRLQLGGIFVDKNLEKEVKAYPGWDRVDYLGWIGREEVQRVMQSSIAGLVTLLPVPNYVSALPIKMFEYMSAGMAVIASDFPLWREIVIKDGCGICVNPKNPESIAEAIDLLVSSPSKSLDMGRRGKRSVLERYSWHFEEIKLLRIYSGLAAS